MVQGGEYGGMAGKQGGEGVMGEGKRGGAGREDGIWPSGRTNLPRISTPSKTYARGPHAGGGGGESSGVAESSERICINM